MEATQSQTADQKEIKCKSCGASLKFMPGTTKLGCEFCGAENEIEFKGESVVELNFDKYLAEYLNKSDTTVKVSAVKCGSCGAQTQLGENIVASECDFCGNPVAMKDAATCSLIKPQSILPFTIDREKGFGAFKKWVSSIWFAPNDLKKKLDDSEKIAGMYIPYWTFDADTNTWYTGMRGVDRTETYTAYEDGKSVTRTRTKTDWYPASGHVSNTFDDVLVVGSNSLPKTYMDALEPWDLKNLVPFDGKFLSGFKTESYGVDLKMSYDESKKKMEVVIREHVKRHIGGNKQQITSMDTTNSNITFKHILLPVWLSAFKYKGKSYRFMINGRTGEVQGERPYSFWKIFFLVITILGVIGTGILLYMKYGK